MSKLFWAVSKSLSESLLKFASSHSEQYFSRLDKSTKSCYDRDDNSLIIPVFQRQNRTMLVRVRIKSIIYRAAIILLRVFWRLIGGRRISAFGHEIIVSPKTTFPSYRKLRLPKGGCHSEIVKYADYVQFHAIVTYVSQLKGPPVIVDIGAHHGAYAVVLGKLIEPLNGKVIAVEPNPESYSVLSKNIQLNALEATVVCENVAVSDTNGSMHIALSGSESRITPELQKQGYRVSAVTMERLLKRNAIHHIHLLIIDVEGAELLVLLSFPWQEVQVDNIFCELHPYAWKDFGYTGADMSNFLAEHGYRCFDMYFREYDVFDTDAYIGPTFFSRIKS